MKNHTHHARHHAGLMALIGLTGSAIMVLGTARLTYAQAVAPSWIVTNNLNTPRRGHTATLLVNGKVLVAGGVNSSFLNSAELYDPATSTWETTGTLSVPRYLCSATLLQDGRVLVAGGYTSTHPPDFGVTNTAELYDPVTGAWSLTGNLNTTRAWHSATLLRNGKVLIAGGGDVFSIFNSAELYDPATGTWSVTGSLSTERYGQTATLLQDGNVLIAGGSDDGDLATTLASVELYDSVAGAWTSINSLGTTRVLHTATLLPGGKVVASGGYMRNSWPPTSLKSAELYDPATRSWSRAGTLSGARNNHTATLLTNGQVLVTGGYDWNRLVFLTSAELFDLSTGSWTIAAELNTARDSHSATFLRSGKVLVAGGFNNTTGTLDSAELYDPGTVPVPNPIDDAQFFVRQHYLDFLNRPADDLGLAFWTNEITSCGFDPQCIEIKRSNVSAAFFLSIEFQETGYLVHRMYKAAYGSMPASPVPLTPQEFMPDAHRIGQGVVVGAPGWEQMLENNKNGFASEFVARSRFTTAFSQGMTSEQFVDTLNANAGGALLQAERDQLVRELASGAKTRAQVLRSVAEDADLAQAEFNKAFVLMQYFGYLRRNPNDPPELTLDFEGYNFWLIKLTQFNGDYIGAEMVKAFITSGEYRQRF